MNAAHFVSAVFYCNLCVCPPLQINCTSLEQELFHRLLFPGFHHTSVLPAQQDCVWHGSWYNCCQALQSQMTQKSAEGNPTVMLSRHRVMFLLKMPAELKHGPFQVPSEHAGVFRCLQSLIPISMNCFSSLQLVFGLSQTRTVFLHVCLHAAFRICPCAKLMSSSWRQEKWRYMLLFQ